ncbi:NUDIX domain-containing protein [Streptomyces sp. NPDC001980]|uniref:NUDIX domain-containing protein n=1 Tax=Streptomyces sp. NPDC001980 TaxID=3157126 RepID=UPI0033167DFE
MTSPPPSDSAAHGTAMSAAAYRASRTTLWTGVPVLITDTAGRILLQHVTYRTTRLLPGGGVDVKEAPSQAAARGVLEEPGVHLIEGVNFVHPADLPALMAPGNRNTEPPTAQPRRPPRPAAPPPPVGAVSLSR